MSKKIQLSIPTPCHENWDNMSPVDKGRFCGSCQKQVVDFSRMSDREIATFFKKPSTGSVCGRFMQDQLDRDIEIPKKRIPWLKYFFQFALPAFLVSLKASAQCEKPTKGKVVKTSVRPLLGDTIVISPVNNNVLMKGEPEPLVDTPAITGNLRIDPIKTGKTNQIVNGIVKDQEGITLPGTTVRKKGTRIGTAADNNGRFRIEVRTGDILVVSGAGLETTEKVINNSNEIIIIVKRLEIVGGEVVITNTPVVFGRIVDEDGMSIVGATVKNMDNKRATASNLSGDFSLERRSGKGVVLEVSAPGYETNVKKYPASFRQSYHPIIVQLKKNTTAKVIFCNIPLISGHVVNESGEPIASATIRVDDKHMAITNDSGYFSLQGAWVKRNASLEVSAVGYQAIREKYSTDYPLTIQLKRKIETLPEAVVTTLGVTRLVVGAVVRGQTIIKRENPVMALIPQPIKDTISRLFRLYPNPASSGSTLHIEWKQQETGDYTLALFSLSGQLIISKDMWIDEEARLLELQLPSVSAGTYFLRITGKDSGKQYTEKIIIK